MLILTRKPNEKILVGDNVEIVLLGINGTQAKIGIAAPKDINIVREEIKDKPRKQDIKPVIIIKKSKRKVSHGKE